ncbi:hypothetical protein BD770DRAFT_385421 [Pilaira anomala]|nr:hypothetical protein BD770DRAFT_385421 [Pilaira anomala]
MADEGRLPNPRTRVMAPWQLKEYMDENKITLDADYQRGVVWGKKKMQFLIDSIFNNYYIPPLLFATHRVNNQTIRTVVDGKQRLTAVKRFMDNEFAYVDEEVEQEKYYCADAVKAKDKEYLTEEEMDHFNRFKFVCIEYQDISRKQEFELFSRVQCGVATTQQDRLKAHDTRIVAVCRDQTSRYHTLQELFSTKGSGVLFQSILILYLTLKNGRTKFEYQLSVLEKFVRSDYDPPQEHVAIVEQTLSQLQKIADNPDARVSITKRNERASNLKMIEMVLFMMFRKEVQRPRSTRNYADDFRELRNELIRRRGRMVIGKDTFLQGLKCVDERLESENLIPITRPEVYTIGSDSNDSPTIKYDVDEDDDSDDYNQPCSSTQKRTIRAGVPTARRGRRM